MMNQLLARYAAPVRDLAATIATTPRAAATHIKNIPVRLDALQYARRTRFSPPADHAPAGLETGQPNPLRDYFETNTTGPGIWKWEHYFDIYHRHLARFIGQEGGLAEIGVYSGGSLPMWRSYFGPAMHIQGIDIETACNCYRSEGIDISIGDQSNRDFWADFRRKMPRVDIVIDDGGHLPEQQRVTLEEMLPHLAPGGVYICEDIHGAHNKFADYVSGLCNAMNEGASDGGPGMKIVGFQSWFHSIHIYPLAVVIEKNIIPRDRLIDLRRGTEWQPFFEKAH